MVKFQNNGYRDMKWVPVQMLEAREDVRLLEEDIGELQSLATLVEDFEWFGELERKEF